MTRSCRRLPSDLCCSRGDDWFSEDRAPRDLEWYGFGWRIYRQDQNSDDGVISIEGDATHEFARFLVYRGHGDGDAEHLVVAGCGAGSDGGEPAGVRDKALGETFEFAMFGEAAVPGLGDGFPAELLANRGVDHTHGEVFVTLRDVGEKLFGSACEVVDSSCGHGVSRQCVCDFSEAFERGLPGDAESRSDVGPGFSEGPFGRNGLLETALRSPHVFNGFLQLVHAGSQPQVDAGVNCELTQGKFLPVLPSRER